MIPYSIKPAISQFTPEFQDDDRVKALTPIYEKQQKQFIHTPIFYKNQHTFWKGYIKSRNVLNSFKKAFLVLKLNFLFPQSLDILKE